MGLFNRSGYWAFSSKTDPRWHAHGHVECLIVSAGIPEEAQRALDALKAEYGSEPPKDLTFSCCKD